MHRWYCGECQTPAGNTLGPKVPFVGMVHSFLDPGALGRTLDDVLGRPVAYGFPESASGGAPPHTRQNPQLRYLARATASLGKWWLTGAGKPSPFFDETGAPRALVRVLSAEERARLGSN
jgi:hypothetical protein